MSETLFADLVLRYTYKGDLPGHEFHGNQYTEGGGSGGGESGGGDGGGSSEYATGKRVLFEKPKTYDGKKVIKAAIGTHIDEGGSINGITDEHQDASLKIQETGAGSKKFDVIHSHFEGSGKATQNIKDVIHHDLPLKEAKSKAQDWLERKDMEHRSKQ